MKSGQCPVWMTRKPRKGNFKELKSKNISWGSLPPDPSKSICLRRSFRKFVSIYPRSTPVSIDSVKTDVWKLKLRQLIVILSLFQRVPVKEIKWGYPVLEKYILSAGTKTTVDGSTAELERFTGKLKHWLFRWVCFLLLFIIRKLEKWKCLQVSRPNLSQIYYKKH